MRKKQSWQKDMDMTPVCDRCGKVATIEEKMSNENWIAYRAKDPCDCGGEFVSKWLLEMRKENQ